MKSNLKFFKKKKILPVDKFFERVLYNSKFGYYSTHQPFGAAGDFITSPKISSLFSEMIAIWIISTWELFGKPKSLNIIELFKEYSNKNLALILIEDSKTSNEKIYINTIIQDKKISKSLDLKKKDLIYFKKLIELRSMGKQLAYLTKKNFFGIQNLSLQKIL